MSEKSKGIFGKLIDTADKSHACIYFNFSSKEDAQFSVIQKNEKSAEINDDDNKALALLLSDIQSQFKQRGISLNRVQGQPEEKHKLTAGLKADKASLSDAEVALQKMQLRAQELGAELVLTDRPAEMANEPWRLPAVSGQENRAADMPVAEGLAKLAVAVQAVTDTCPLQITLMIRPDLRPQVTLNVSAGEVNWIFAAKEGRYPLKDLLARMAGKTVTHGWDAIVVYQRGQANMLLKQQYIKRFTEGNTLSPLNDVIETQDEEWLYTHNLTLSAPYLSFADAGTGDSVAQVSMNFIKGMIITTQESDDGTSRMKTIEKINPLNSPFIGMEVPLSKAPGSVSEIGEVQFDIKEGDNLTNNLVVSGVSQEMVNSFFKRHFDNIPEEQLIFKLGKFDNFKNEQFQPEEFVIRTMGAPNTQSRGSQDEGDGAVVLFVQVKNGSKEHGKTEADWLLADDYPSALVLSNSRLFDGMVKGPVETGSILGQKIYNWHYVSDSGDNSAGKLLADAAILQKMEKRNGPNGIYLDETLACILYTDITLSDSQNIPLSIRPAYKDSDKYDICCDFKHVGVAGRYGLEDRVTYPGHEEVIKYDGIVSADMHVTVQYSPVISDDIVSFIEKPEWFSSKIKTYDYMWEWYARDEYMSGEIIDAVNEGFTKQMSDSHLKIELQDLNTFTLRNLLFPGENYFRVQHARVPGDLLVMGKLGAGSESFSVTPTEITMVAGSDYQFTTTPEVSGVKWSLSDSEKGNANADLGHIDAATGKYTAPQAAAVTEGVRHVVVCAEKGDTKVYVLASVLAHSVNISPMYQSVAPGKSATLVAESLNGGELSWKLNDNPQGSTLTKISNNEYTYTAGKRNAKLKLNLERISVTDETGSVTDAMILVRNVTLRGNIAVSCDDVPENSVKLTYFSDSSDPDSMKPAADLVWTVLESGGTTLDPETGILSCGQVTDNGFAVLSAKYFDEDEESMFYCPVVIPLPLSTYKETILAAYSPEQ
ncbi:hypothetical protein KWH75_13830 [Morganella morganii]|nr:hypothetical protein [Morganella morganii]